MSFAVYGTRTKVHRYPDLSDMSKLGCWKHTTAFHKSFETTDTRHSNTLDNTDVMEIGRKFSKQRTVDFRNWGGSGMFPESRVTIHILMPLFIHSSSVSMCYFILDVSMLECLGKYSCMSFPFPIAILNGILFFPIVDSANKFFFPIVFSQ